MKWNSVLTEGDTRFEKFVIEWWKKDDETTKMRRSTSDSSYIITPLIKATTYKVRVRVKSVNFGVSAWTRTDGANGMFTTEDTTVHENSRIEILEASMV